jgi:hypothetical protein
MIGFLASTATPASTITDATTTLLPQLLTVGGAAIVVGAGILVLRRGWGFFKGLSK